MNINVIIGNASGVQISEGTVDSTQKQTVPSAEKMDFDTESESATCEIENVLEKEETIGKIDALQHILKKFSVGIVENLMAMAIVEFLIKLNELM